MKILTGTYQCHRKVTDEVICRSDNNLEREVAPHTRLGSLTRASRDLRVSRFAAGSYPRLRPTWSRP